MPFLPPISPISGSKWPLLPIGYSWRELIDISLQLIAGRTAQEYNRRKNRKGAFWEDRYHATAIEGADYLFRCLVYIDLNMVRAGVVNHPSEWPYGGYHEIQAPRRKCAVVAYEKLAEKAGFQSYEKFRKAHRTQKRLFPRGISFIDKPPGDGRPAPRGPGPCLR